MAQTGYTPIQLYYSATASSVPLAANLASGELAINTNDGKLYYKDSAGVVQTIASKAGNVNVSSFSAGTTGFTPGTATTGAVTLAGTLATTNGGTGLTSFTANGVVYASSTSALATGSALTFDGAKLSLPTTLAIKGAQNGNNAKIAMTRTDQSWSINNETDLRFYGQNTDTETPSSIAHSIGNTGIFIWNNANTATEQMRLTSTGLGIGTSSISYGASGRGNLTLGGSASGLLGFQIGGVAKGYVAHFDSNMQIWNDVDSPILFGINAAEQMRLTSTGLGIGTSSPSEKLEVYGSTVGGVVAKINNANASGYSQIYLTNSGASGRSYVLASGGNSSASGFANNFYIYDTAAAATRLTLDTSGNLGLGVTPSAWGSNYRAIAVSNGGGDIFGVMGNGTTGIGFNFYNNNTNEIYKFSTYAAKFQVNNAGQFAWFTAPSGTAGNEITFTQAMTLDASGRLLLGATSVTNGTAFGGSGQVNMVKVESSGYPCLQINTNSGGGSSLQFTNGNTVNGVVGYNASGGTNEFTINNALSGTLVFGTNNTERARIDSSGNLLVGNTSVLDYGKITIKYAGSTENGISITPNDGTSTTGYIVFENESNTRIGSITRATTTNAVLYNTTSDYRLKTVTGSVIGQGARIDALKPIDYLWTEGGQQARGFLAHQFQEVYANSVSGTKDAVDADGKPVYQSMQAGSSEVIADLVAEIQSLRKRLADAGI